MLPQIESRSHQDRSARYQVFKEGIWDFYTYAGGGKPGYIENVSDRGCLLRTRMPIENRRWIRLTLQDEETGVHFTAIGRIVRCENRLENWKDKTFTLYRYGVEFTQAFHPLLLEKLKNEKPETCSVCGERSLAVYELNNQSAALCPACHLAKGYQKLLQEPSKRSESSAKKKSATSPKEEMAL